MARKELNDPGLPQLSDLGLGSGTSKGQTRGADDLTATLQMEEINSQLEQAKQIARSAGPAKAHPYLDAVLGIVANALDPEIAGPAFEKASSAAMGPALAAYQHNVESAKMLIEEGERRQKAFQNILAANPEALIPMVPPGDTEAMKQLGLATFGIPIPIDPRLKSQLKLEALQRKNLVTYNMQAARAALQTGNASMAAEYMEATERLIDPDGSWDTTAPIQPKDLVNRKIASQIRLSEITNNFMEADQAKDAWVKFQMDGDHDALMATLGGLHVRPKQDRAGTRMEKQIELSSQLAASMRATGEEDPTAALKGMPEEFQLQWDAVMPKTVAGTDELSRDDILREQRIAYDDALNTARAMGIEDEMEVQATAKGLLRARLRQAEATLKQSNRSTRKIVKTSLANQTTEAPVLPAEAKDIAKSFSAAAHKYATDHKTNFMQAVQAVAVELANKGQARQIPAVYRKKLGL